MSILAEPRRKQRISIDPQNIGWKNSDALGKNMMKKMNWNEGEGLGKHKQGSSENLKLNANFTGKGLGCDRDTRNKEQWISHHDDFANLLANLNKSSKSDTSTDAVTNNDEGCSIQKRSRSMKSRMHYKFTKGKDLTLATQQQKAAIFGHVNVTETQKKTKEESVVIESLEDSASKIMTISTISTTDYYKEKMAKWMTKKSSATDKDQVVEEVIEEVIDEKPAKKRKRSKKSSTTYDDQVEAEEVVEEVVEEKPAKKRKRFEDKKSSKKSKHH